MYFKICEHGINITGDPFINIIVYLIFITFFYMCFIFIKPGNNKNKLIQIKTIKKRWCCNIEYLFKYIIRHYQLL